MTGRYNIKITRACQPFKYPEGIVNEWEMELEDGELNGLIRRINEVYSGKVNRNEKRIVGEDGR